MQKPKGRTFLQRALVAIALLSASCAPLCAQERANNLTFSHPMPPQTNMLPTAPDRDELLRDFKDPFGKVRTGAYWYWISGNSSREGVVKGDARPLGDAEAPAGLRPHGARLLIGGEAAAAGAGVVELFAGVRGGLRGLDVLPAADAGIDEALRLQELERALVDRLAFGLDVFGVPVEAEPAEVLDGLRGGTGLVLRVVEVLGAQDDASPGGPGAQPGDQKRPDVAQVEGARRTRREASYSVAQNFFHSLTNFLRFSSDPKASLVARRGS